jgi:hypothetical protein
VSVHADATLQGGVEHFTQCGVWVCVPSFMTLPSPLFRPQSSQAVSRFSLRFIVVHSIIQEQRLIKFESDDTRANLAMRKANGFWHLQSWPDRPGYARVWYSAEVVVSMLVPSVILDYAAKRALPRATRWLQPHFTGQAIEY